MARANPSSQKSSLCNVAHARWVGRILNMLIAVVGRDTLLGQILRQTQTEIKTILPDKAPKTATKAASITNN